MPLKVALDVDPGLPKLGARTEAGTYDLVQVQGTAGAESLATDQPTTASPSKAVAALGHTLREAATAGVLDDVLPLGRYVVTDPQDIAEAQKAGLHGLAAAIGVEEPITWRVGDYFGQPRDPEQVIASKIDELDAKDKAIEAGREQPTLCPVCSRWDVYDYNGMPVCSFCYEKSVAEEAQSERLSGETELAEGSEYGDARDPRGASAIVSEPLWGDQTPPFTYLAGPAGCGKTFAVKDWQQREKGLMLLATTGIAAINLGGTTVNAALGYFDTRSLQESYTNGFLTARLGRLWKSGVKRLVLDECSMLEGDALTYLVKGVEEVNGRGYVLGKWDEEDETEPPAMGLTLVGDFAQLPPVEGTFAFESPEWHRFAEAGHTITLNEIRRQSDPGFVQMLRQARVGNGAPVLEYFRGRIMQETDDEFNGPTLFAKNDAVTRYNWIRLGRVTGADFYYESRREGDQRTEWGNPKKPPQSWGIPLRLHLKVGALVMVLANNRYEGEPPQPFRYVNGDLGEVVEGNEYSAQVRLQRTGEVQQVSYVRREVQIPIDSARRKELRDKGQSGRITENGKFEITGWVEYLPLRVAYGSTVHKSQGLSLDRVQVNIRDAFFKSPGMLYVALSRARTSEGLRLVGSEAALIERCAADPRLKDFL